MLVFVLRETRLIGDESNGDRSSRAPQFSALDGRRMNGVNAAHLRLCRRLAAPDSLRKGVVGLVIQQTTERRAVT
jgi:hypothetical protein